MFAKNLALFSPRVVEAKRMSRTLSFSCLGILFETALGGLGWALGWALGQPALGSFAWSGRDVGLGVLATVPMLLLFFVCLRCPVGPLQRIKRVADELIKPLFASANVVELALLASAAGFGEEVLFRGFLQSLSVRYLSLWPGILAASAAFGLLHLITPPYAVLATLLGVYLGWLFLATENLLAPITAHALYDFLALAYLLHSEPPRRLPETFPVQAC